MLFSVANIAVWGGTGFNMIVIYTALRAMPAELYEAARIDGASQLQIALRIKIPMVAPALVLTFFFSIIATLQVFSEPTTLRAADQHHLADLEPADEGLPGRVREQRHLLGRRDLHRRSPPGSLVLSFGFLRLSQPRTLRGSGDG